MSSNDFVSFDFVKKSVTILQILDHYSISGTFEMKGDSLVGPCPIHGGSNPKCFRVSVSKNCFKCFGSCKAGGNILDLVSKKEDVSIRKAALLIQDWFHLAPPKEAEEKRPVTKEKPEVKATPTSQAEELATPNPPLPFVLKNLDPNHPSIAELGITEETRATFGLGFCSKGILAGYVAIPVHNKDGLLVAYTGLWLGKPPDDKEKYKFPPGFLKSAEVFNLYRVNETKEPGPLVVVKECLACIKLWQMGLRRVVAIMDNSISKAQVDLIDSIVLSDRRIVMLFDETETGRAERAQISAYFAQENFVKAPVLPDKRKFVEELLDQDLEVFAS